MNHNVFSIKKKLLVLFNTKLCSFNCLVIFFFLSILISKPVHATGWLSGYSDRKKITITGQSGAGTFYQVAMNVGESSGSSGANFNVNGHSTNFPSAKNQGGDLRFTSSDGTTLLYFWVESITGTTPNRVAKIWVKVSDDLGSNKDIYCYYGYSGASNYSNGDNAFILFDDFDGSTINSSKWNTTNSPTVSSSELNLYGASKQVDSKTKITYSGRLAMNAVWRAGSSRDQAMRVIDISDANNDVIQLGNTTYSGGLYTYGTGKYSLSQDANAPNSGSSYQYQLGLSGTTLNWAALGTSSGTRTLSSTVDNKTFYFAVSGGGVDYPGGYVDWFLARKYTSPEPAFSSAGSEEAPIAPTVTTQAVSSIASITATGNGNVTSDGGETITERGICWNTSTSPTTAYNKAISTGTTGAYTAAMTGLSAGILYYVKAYAINSVGISYGNEVTFTTLNIPTVSTPTATSITTNTAIMGANVTSDGGATITARGTCWGTSANPSTNCVAEGGTTTGVFTQSRTGLISSALIYYRGYATNSVGTGYSSDATITTPAPATVDWNNSNVQEITLSSNRSFTFINGKSGGIYHLIIKQDGTGGRAVSWSANVKWTGGIVPTFTTTANAINAIKFVYDGTNYLVLSTTLDIK